MRIENLNTNRISLLPIILSEKEKQNKNDFLYWESEGRDQAIRMNNWKAVRHQPDTTFELYNIENDPTEKNNIADNNLDIINKIKKIIDSNRVVSKLHPLVLDIKTKE